MHYYQFFLVDFLLEFNCVCEIFTVSVQMVCENLEVLRKLCEKSRCFPGKCTQLVVTVATNLNSDFDPYDHLFLAS